MCFFTKQQMTRLDDNSFVLLEKAQFVDYLWLADVGLAYPTDRHCR